MHCFPLRYCAIQVLVFEGRMTEETTRIKIGGEVGLMIDFPHSFCNIQVIGL
jgi:hypothetical protein